MRNGSKKREFTRVSTKIRAEVTATLSGWTRDMSVKGLYLVCDRTLPVGTQCQVSVLLGETSPQVHIEISGKVVRVDESGMAIEFSKMELESFDHLRRLVLYNSTETDQVEQELKTHLGLKRRSSS